MKAGGKRREDLWEQLKRNEILPVYVLFGDETFLRDRAAKTIADTAFADGELRDFNEAEFSLEIADNLRNALAAAEQLPMMASRRVIRLVDVRVAQSSTRDTLREDNESILSAYLERPAPTTTLILLANELNGNRKMGRLLKALPGAFEFCRLEQSDLVKWADRRIKEVGAMADPPTTRYLVSLTGDDVRRLNSEIEKLAVGAMPEGTITTELIDKLVANNREISTFDLPDHLAAGRGKAAVTTLRKMLDDGAEPVALVGALAFGYRRLMIAKEMMDARAGRNEIASALKLYGTWQDKLLATARRADAARLDHAIRRIAETDLAIKTSVGGGGPAGAEMQLEVLVCELASM
jgi:DNA polymerase III subunit delta